MPDRFDVVAVTGDDLVRFALDGDEVRDAETLLRGAGATCAAVDAADPDRIYVGTFDDGLHVTADGGRTWQRARNGRVHPRAAARLASCRDGPETSLGRRVFAQPAID